MKQQIKTGKVFCYLRVSLAVLYTVPYYEFGLHHASYNISNSGHLKVNSILNLKLGSIWKIAASVHQKTGVREDHSRDFVGHRAVENNFSTCYYCSISLRNQSPFDCSIQRQVCLMLVRWRLTQKRYLKSTTRTFNPHIDSSFNSWQSLTWAFRMMERLQWHNRKRASRNKHRAGSRICFQEKNLSLSM